MRALLAALGDPQRALPGDPRRRHERQVDRDTDDRGAAARRGARAGAYISPHVVGWAERIGSTARRPTSSGPSRGSAPTRRRSAPRSSRRSPPLRSPSSPTREVDVAVVEAGLGGRLDATNVLDAAVVLLTNVALEHTEVLGETREEIAAEKLAVARQARSLSCRTTGVRARSCRAPTIVVGRRATRRPRRSSAAASTPQVRRRARRAGSSAARRARSGTARTTPVARAGSLDAPPARRLRRRRLDPRRQGRRRDARALWPRGRTLRRDAVVATRAHCPPSELAALARRALRAGRDRARARRGALARARELGRAGARDGLALSPRRSGAGEEDMRTMTKRRERLSVFAFAALVARRDRRARVRRRLCRGQAAAVRSRVTGHQRRLLRGCPRLLRLRRVGRVRNLGDLLRRRLLARDRYWVYKDARRRIEDPWLVAMATLLGLVPPFVGPLIYMLFRPPEYLEDVRERELEIKAMEERLAAARPALPGLPRGRRRDRSSSARSARRSCRQACVELHGPLEALWQVCPYCADAGPTPAGASIEPLDDALRPRRARERPHRLRLDSARRWPRSAHSSWSSRTRSPRPRRRDRRALRAARPRAARRAAPHVDRALAQRALRRAHGEAVLRRARRLHHLGADAGARRSRARARSRPSGRRWARRTRPTPAPGTIRGDFALDAGQPRPRLRLAGERAARDRAVFPDGSCLSHAEDARRNRDVWTKANAEYTGRDARASAWARTRSHWGIFGVPSRDLERARRRRRPGRRRARLRHRVLLGVAGAARRAAGRRRRHAGPARRRRGAMQAEFGLEFPLVEASAEDVPLPDASFDLAVSEYGASIWCDPDRWIPEAARLLRPGGRLVFLRNCTLVDPLLARRGAGRRSGSSGPQRGIGRIEWPGETGVEFHLAARRLDPPPARERASRSSDLIELQAPEDAETTTTTTSSGRVGAAVAGRGDLGRAQARVTPPARPRVHLAAAPRDPRAAGDPVRRRCARLRGARPPAPIRSSSPRARRREGALGRRAPGERRCSASTRGPPRRDRLGKPRRRDRRRADARSSRGERTRSSPASACARRAGRS